MRQDLHLFIGNREIDFKTSPDILYNYAITDSTNPTVVKNSFSKTITVEGTDNNNDIFGHMWNLERLQQFGTGVYTGASFNPLQKADFTLFINGSIYESGYVKLDEVRRTGNSIEYNITLFGGLGSFFYNLTYSHNESGEVEGPDKLSLADLTYKTEYESEPEISRIKINKDTLWDAWQTIIGGNGHMACDTEEEVAAMGGRPNAFLYDSKWKEFINFAPCYNGLPEDFSSDKVLVNFTGMENDGIIPMSQDGFTPYNNYGLINLPYELTEWETFDLRSYLQRPVIKMSRIIEACCNPANNGGYEVKLDPHFFNTDNPYWRDSWFTLPLLDFKSEASGMFDAADPRATRNGDYYYDLDGQVQDPDMQFSNATVGVRLRMNTSSAAEAVYLHYSLNAKHRIGYVKNMEHQQDILVQLVAYDELGRAVTSSDVMRLTSEGGNDKANSTYGFNQIDGVPVGKYEKSEGYFKRIGNNMVWCDTDGSEQALYFTLKSKMPFARLALKVLTPYRTHWNIYGDWLSKNDDGSDNQPLYTSIVGYSAQKRDSSSAVTISNAVNTNKVTGTLSLIIDSLSYASTEESNLHLNLAITKRELLETGYTPCDYLLSFCKIFGLYFYKEPDAKIIHIMDRHTFYKRDEVVNLEELIDRSKGMKITPQVAQTKWYDFNLEQVESELGDEYKENYGIDYGLQRVNTSYNFDSEKTDLLQGNIFKGAIQTLESNKHYAMPFDGKYPAYVFNKATVSLFKVNDDDLDDEEVSIKRKNYSKEPINLLGYPNYDAFHKPQFHSGDHSASDGSNVLLFFNRFANNDKELRTPYWLTDDMLEMGELNDGDPCWILTADIHHRGGSTDEDKEVKIGYRCDPENPNDGGYILGPFPSQFNGSLVINAQGEYTDGDGMNQFNITKRWTIKNGNPEQDGWYDDTDYDFPFFRYMYYAGASGITVTITETNGWYNVVLTSEMRYREAIDTYAIYTISPKTQGGGGDEQGAIIAYRMDRLPAFTRYLTVNQLNGNITHSMDFGLPKVIYEPEQYITDEQSIYAKCWKAYMNDMYSVNARILTCSCLIEDKPNPDWMRRFYWFDNSLWRLNKIKDWNVGSLDTTEMEFIKVQDRNSYDLTQIKEMGAFSIELATYEIGPEGGSVEGIVHIQSGWNWYASQSFGYYTMDDENLGYLAGYDYPDTPADSAMQPLKGTDGTKFTFTVPANPYPFDIKYRVRVENDADDSVYVWLVQKAAQGSHYLEVVPETITVDSEGHIESASVRSNLAWEVIIVGGDK